MKRTTRKLAAVLILSGLGPAGGLSYASEFEVLDKLSVDGYSVFRGSADIPGGSFAVGGSTFVVKGGNVGIGTTNPGNSLDVAGVIHASSYISANADIIGYANVQVRSGTSFIAYNGSNDAYSYIKNTAGSAQSSLTLGAGGADRLTILNGGNIGIGTANPGFLLDVGSAGSSGIIRVTNNTYGDWVLQKRRSDDSQLFGIKEAGGNGAMAFLTNNTQRMVIDYSGNVGIGTTSPSATLHVVNNSAIPVAVGGSYADSGVLSLINTAAGGRTYNVGSTGSGSGAGNGYSVFDVTGSATRLLINPAGNVGLGTAGPVAKLHVDNPEGTTAYPLYIPSAYSITTSGADNNGAQRTYTLTIPNLNLHTSVVTIDISGWYYNNGADFWQARYVYNLMSESTAARVNQRQSALEFTAGTQRSSAPGTATLATTNVFTIAITVTAGYYSRMVVTTVGGGTQQTTISVQ